MLKAKLVEVAGDQVVVFPLGFRIDDTEVVLKRVSGAIVLLPVSAAWETLVQSLPKFPADFMPERRQD